MVILVGPSGAGKSTWTEALRAREPEAVVCSADDWFLGSDGVYRWSKEGLFLAHRECQRRVSRALLYEVPTVVVDNTNTKLEDVGLYIAMGTRRGYAIEVIVFRKERDPEVLAKRNKHGVSKDVIKRHIDNIDRMLAEWPATYPKYVDAE